LSCGIIIHFLFGGKGQKWATWLVAWLSLYSIRIVLAFVKTAVSVWWSPRSVGKLGYRCGILHDMENVKIVNRALVIRDGRLLVVRNAGNDFWCLPGGKLESSDATLRGGLVREMHEELAVDVTVGDLAFVQEFRERGIRYVDFFWQAELAGEVSFDNIERVSDGELMDARWVLLSEMDQLDFKPEALPGLLGGENTASCPQVFLG
jgi:ADP-ribose pyrophosphatase YjhB (NUDIX family)